MTAQIKTSLAWITSLLLVFAAWTLQYQTKPIAGVLVIGVAGTLLIFFAEFVYSYRKRGHIKVGSVRNWLRVHIAVGIIGPFVILWHTGLNFHGFAGWLAMLTGIVLMSGFTGRYIYRQIPRTIKGRELSLKEIQARIEELNASLHVHLDQSPQAVRVVQDLRSRFPVLGSQSGAGQAAGWHLMFKLAIEWHRGRITMRRRPLDGGILEQVLVDRLWGLELERLGLVRRIRVLKTAKSLLAKWRLMHIPLTLALFSGILIHMGSVFYYGKVLP